MTQLVLLFLTFTFQSVAFAGDYELQIQEQVVQVNISQGPFFIPSTLSFQNNLRVGETLFMLHRAGSPAETGGASGLQMFNLKTQQFSTVVTFPIGTTAFLENVTVREFDPNTDKFSPPTSRLRVHQLMATEQYGIVVYTRTEINQDGKILAISKPSIVKLAKGEEASSLRIIGQVNSPEKTENYEGTEKPFFISVWNSETKSKQVYYAFYALEDSGMTLTLVKPTGLEQSTRIVGLLSSSSQKNQDDGPVFNYILAQNPAGLFQMYLLSERLPKQFSWDKIATETRSVAKFFDRAEATNGSQSLAQTWAHFSVTKLQKVDRSDKGRDPQAGGVYGTPDNIYVELRNDEKFVVTQAPANALLARVDLLDNKNYIYDLGVWAQVDSQRGNLCQYFANKQEQCVVINPPPYSMLGPSESQLEPERPELELLGLTHLASGRQYILRNSNQKDRIQIFNQQNLKLELETITSGEPGIDILVTPGNAQQRLGNWLMILRSDDITALLLKSVWKD